jgi:5-methylthioribose kinase
MALDIDDLAALGEYLTRHGFIKSGGPVSFQKLLGGVSNRTVKVTWGDGRGWVLKQALAKLRVKEDWFSSPDRISVEAKALRWLNRLAPPGTTPSFIFEDPANNLMAMAAIPEEYEDWKSVLLSGQVDPDHFEQFGFLLGTIHCRSARSGSDVCRAFADTTYFENQGKLILLDYEVVHFGDPAFDAGFALTHFLSKAHHVRQERAALAAAAALFWRAYTKEVAPLAWEALEPRVVRHALACLLARVAGKSPLEYLTPKEAARQQEIALLLMSKPPIHITDLIAEFVGEIEAHAEN